MTYPLAMFVLGVAVGQVLLLAVGVLMHRAKERQEWELRGKYQTPVVRAWPPRWDSSRETMQ